MMTDIVRKYKEEYPNEYRYYDFIPRKERNIVILKCKYIECRQVVYQIREGRKYFLRPHSEQCPQKAKNESKQKTKIETPKKQNNFLNLESYGLSQSFRSRKIEDSQCSNDSFEDINAIRYHPKENEKPLINDDNTDVIKILKQENNELKKIDAICLRKENEKNKEKLAELVKKNKELQAKIKELKELKEKRASEGTVPQIKEEEQPEKK